MTLWTGEFKLSYLLMTLPLCRPVYPVGQLSYPDCTNFEVASIGSMVSGMYKKWYLLRFRLKLLGTIELNCSIGTSLMFLF
jgi:hypothetical protein